MKIEKPSLGTENIENKLLPQVWQPRVSTKSIRKTDNQNDNQIKNPL